MPESPAGTPGRTIRPDESNGSDERATAPVSNTIKEEKPPMSGETKPTATELHQPSPLSPGKAQIKHQVGSSRPKGQVQREVKEEKMMATGKDKGHDSDDDDMTEDEATEEVEVKDTVKDEKEVAKAKERHQADLKHHHYEPPQAERVQDDWQVAYVWAFIVKFNQIAKIRKLECLEDFEQCLTEQVANRPDDVLEGILVQFLKNLKPGMRNLDCTNIQHHLSAYISDALLNDAEFTVWDRPWAPNEQPRGSCCNNSPERSELGRLRYEGEDPYERVDKNPIKQVEERGGGLFELSWRERARLLRQLVDWQLAYSEEVKVLINRHNRVGESRGAKKPAAGQQADAEESSISLTELGLDRARNRIWSLDHSPRLYKSGNPFKRPCPLITISTTRAEFESLLNRYTEHGGQTVGKLKSKSGQKPTKAEVDAHRSLVRGVGDEKQLAAKLEELLPLLEKEEQRISKARRKIAAANELAQQAEFRSTRTRRTGRNVNYRVDDGDEDDDEDYYNDGRRSSKRSRRDNAAFETPSGLDHRGRPIIPGERRSSRITSGTGATSTSTSKYRDWSRGSPLTPPLSNNDGGDDNDSLSSLSEPQGNGPTASGSRSGAGRGGKRNGVNGIDHSNGNGGGGGGGGSASGSGSTPNATNGSGPAAAAGTKPPKPKKVKGMKGYVWIEEIVPEDEPPRKPRGRPPKNPINPDAMVIGSSNTDTNTVGIPPITPDVSSVGETPASAIASLHDPPQEGNDSTTDTMGKMGTGVDGSRDEGTLGNDNVKKGTKSMGKEDDDLRSLTSDSVTFVGEHVGGRKDIVTSPSPGWNGPGIGLGSGEAMELE